MRISALLACVCLLIFAFGCNQGSNFTLPPKKVKPESAAPIPAGRYIAIQDILTKNCMPCHSGATPAGSLDLTNYNGVMKGGAHGPIVLAGGPGVSALYTKISGPNPQMPKGRKPLSAQDTKAIFDWILRGPVNGELSHPIVNH